MVLDLPFEILWNLLEKTSQEPHLPTLISNSLLKEACKAEKSEFVKILVKNGSRLVFEGKNDKVNDLYILKLMVKKDYILSCYQGAKYLVFVSSHFLKTIELTFAQFLYFLRAVCLFFNF